jgi:hypothetical protein
MTAAALATPAAAAVAASPPCAWPVPRAGATPLLFALEPPPGIDLVELSALTAAAPAAPAALAGGSRRLRSAADDAGVFLMAAICNRPAPGERREVAATVTIALTAACDGDPMPGAGSGGEDAQVEVLSEQATRITRVKPLPQAQSGLVLLVQYLLRTRYGVLAMTFSTVRADMMGTWGLSLFEAIMRTGFLGEPGEAPGA